MNAAINESKLRTDHDFEFTSVRLIIVVCPPFSLPPFYVWLRISMTEDGRGLWTGESIESNEKRTS